MSYDRRIAHLEESHKFLDRELDEAETFNAPDHIVSEIKKKKLHVKDEIHKLQLLDAHERDAE